MTVGLPEDSNIWVEAKTKSLSVDKDLCPAEYAEVTLGQVQGSLLTFKGYESASSVPYATTTLVPPVNSYMSNRLLIVSGDSLFTVFNKKLELSTGFHNYLFDKILHWFYMQKAVSY